MKHPSARELFAHWEERRRARAMPERAEIEPGAIRRALADTFILAFDPGMGHPFRLAGTRVCALFGREIKGESFLDLFADGARRELHELIAIIADEATGLVASAGELGRRGVSLELLLLPLADQIGGGTARLLGALAPTEPALWLGTRTVGPLALGSYRFLNPTEAMHQAPPAPTRVPTRPNLVVYHGGRR